MLARLWDVFAGREAAADQDVCLAAAALMVEAATLDGHMDESERGLIHALLAERFGLDDQSADELIARAKKTVSQSVQLFSFTRAIKDAFGQEDRVRMIEMLWEVAYADGHLHDYEANLVRRVCGLIYVSDVESGSARQRAMARLGINSGLV